MRFLKGVILLCSALPAILAAQGEPPRSVPKGAAPLASDLPEPGVAVAKIGENRYRLGKIEFDSKTREVRVPVVVNMREGGPVEYLLVHEQGKVHESVLATAINPLHLQIVLKLLRYRTGFGDVFNRLLPEDLLEKEGGDAADRGETVAFFFTPNEGEPIPAYELVVDGENAEAMEAGGWTFTGSVVEDGTFMAEAEGSIVAIYLDPLAMFNMTRDGAHIDSRWGARTSAIPELGTLGLLSILPGDSIPGEEQ